MISIRASYSRRIQLITAKPSDRTTKIQNSAIARAIVSGATTKLLVSDSDQREEDGDRHAEDDGEAV
jgi:hypothetical protein